MSILLIQPSEGVKCKSLIKITKKILLHRVGTLELTVPKKSDSWEMVITFDKSIKNLTVDNGKLIKCINNNKVCTVKSAVNTELSKKNVFVLALI